MFKHCSDIFFDLDHTLWDFEKNSAISFQLVFDEMNFNVSLDDFQKVYQPINFDYWKLYRDNKISKETLRYGRLKDAFDLMNLQVSDEQINQISEGYIRYLSHQVH